MENKANLREWFERVDSEKTGSLTAPQLKSAFSVGNLEFSLSVVQQMIRMYDFDRNGTMSFEEFVALNKFLIKVQQAFSDFERGRGFLGLDEVYEALVKIGFSLDSPAFCTVCEDEIDNQFINKLPLFGCNLMLFDSFNKIRGWEDFCHALALDYGKALLFSIFFAVLHFF
ncbi:hypothetical protein SLEP1_g33569 [Rubroshorea leprosula]|uniref:EF-hand domain-containing protein n=1 Tax=Rubroshorea leprosula TaxID=152421 RepID=A0AAV5KH09_9ROSI|nr:hypothetical protein SLEP1_g33569 [Rubroshorea leprosula]